MSAGSRWKDWLLASLLLGAVVGGWAALRAGRASRNQLQRMLRDMEQLRKAELALDDMQKELEKARLEQVREGNGQAASSADRWPLVENRLLQRMS